jgi:hypothetical protein
MKLSLTELQALMQVVGAYGDGDPAREPILKVAQRALRKLIKAQGAKTP